MARSRHCQACKHCIARYDHHCVWINGCVGLHNYKYFLTFLALHAVLTSYGAIAGVLLLLADAEPLLKEKRYYTGQKMVTGHWPSVCIDVMQKHTALLAVILLCLFVSFLVWNFLLYHLYLIKTGLTTYERYKLGEIHHDAKETVQFYRRWLELGDKFVITEQDATFFSVSSKEKKTTAELEELLEEARDDVARCEETTIYKPASLWAGVVRVFDSS